MKNNTKPPFKLLVFKDYKTKNCYVHNPKVSNRNNNKNQVSLPPLGVTNCFQSSQSFLSFIVFKFWVAFVFNYGRRDKPRTSIKARVLIVPEVLVRLKGLRERKGQFGRVDLPESFPVNVVPALWIFLLSGPLLLYINKFVSPI